MTNKVFVTFAHDAEDGGVTFPKGAVVPGERTPEGVRINDRTISGQEHFFPWEVFEERYLHPDTIHEWPEEKKQESKP